MSGSLSLFDSLSIRELTVMIMIANGMDAHTIAEKLYVNTKTVNTYRHHLYKKLNLKNDVELTSFSIEKDLLDKKFYNTNQACTHLSIIHCLKFSHPPF